MLTAGSFRGPVFIALLLAPIALACNLLLAVGVAREALVPTLALAFVPAAAFVFGALTATHRYVLAFAGLALNMTVAPLNEAVLGPLYPADLLVLLALGSWVAEGLLRLRAGERPRWPDSAVLGWPLLLFAVAMLVAVARGYDAYGSAPIGGPVRLVAYAGIACALAGATPQQMYRGVVAVFYTGTIWMFLNALYYLSTGTSQTRNFDISTGGTRVLALTVSLNLAIALFLALLNLQVDTSAGMRLLHIAVATLAAFGIVLGYGRGIYIAVALLLLLVLIGARRVRGALTTVIPLVLPFVLIGFIVVPRLMPDLGPTFVSRITTPPSEDRNVRFRGAANKASLELFHESPAIGVGFGRSISFTLDGRRYDLRQGSHNSLLWILSGAGAIGLGAFAIMCMAFLGDAWRRLRSAVESRERVLITWSVVALATIIIDSATMQIITAPSTLVTIWILFLLPTVVPRRSPATGPSLGEDPLARNLGRAAPGFPG